MMGALEHRSALPGVAGVEFRPTGLELDPGMSFDRWTDVVGLVGRIGGAVPWWIGDLVNHGEAVYGERYAQALDLTGLAYSTLANAAYVARRFPSSRRRENLSFAHHAAVAGLEPAVADEWLERAEAEGWTRAELRRQLKAADASPEDVLEQRSIRLVAPRSRWEAWEAKAAPQSLAAIAFQILSEWGSSDAA